MGGSSLNGFVWTGCPGLREVGENVVGRSVRLCGRRVVSLKTRNTRGGPIAAAEAPGNSGKDGEDARESGVGAGLTGGKRKRAADFIAEGVQDDVPEYRSEEEEVLLRENGSAGVKLPEMEIGLPMDPRLMERITAGVVDKSDPFLRKDKEALGNQVDGVEGDAGGSNGKPVDLLGDGGVRKVVIESGRGEKPTKGSTVMVHYVGKLESDGSVFDDSRDKGAGEPFSFVLGEGSVIKGWEVAVATMRKGERAKITCAPAYAYGRRGAPPVIPQNATLEFEVELLSITRGASEDERKSPQRFSDDNPDVPRTPDEIANAYFAKMASKTNEGGGGFWERFYFISPFASQSGQAPPWWINPNITFVGVFVLVGLAFYLVFVSGGIRQGVVTEPIDVNVFK
uniref:peptidylprolyl isomerase n=1 Tax=Compsopogon caeruleus TaxID=31354 RepID=A0A7S1TBH7_9RHOD|mmetsp:Transcript_16471/g.33612  ORF Transcript_16471/g.33612 Transcript_16471/m.33612 type:complete len:397 (+) Transcript_16471:129-1319(+)